MTDRGKSRIGLTNVALLKGAVQFFFFPTGAVAIYPLRHEGSGEEEAREEDAAGEAQADSDAAGSSAGQQSGAAEQPDASSVQRTDGDQGQLAIAKWLHVVDNDGRLQVRSASTDVPTELDGEATGRDRKRLKINHAHL